MEEKKFEELLIAVKGKDKAKIQGKEAVQILTELLNGEFGAIEERKFKVMLRKPKGGGRASISKVNDQVYLFINPDVRPESLRAVLRHELLHLEGGKFSSDGSLLDDHDPKFKAMARARKIDVWNV